MCWDCATTTACVVTVLQLQCVLWLCYNYSICCDCATATACVVTVQARHVPGCRLQLGDRPIQITLKRALGALSVWQKVKLAWYLITTKDPIRWVCRVSAGCSGVKSWDWLPCWSTCLCAWGRSPWSGVCPWVAGSGMALGCGVSGQ